MHARRQKFLEHAGGNSAEASHCTLPGYLGARDVVAVAFDALGRVYADHCVSAIIDQLPFQQRRCAHFRRARSGRVGIRYSVGTVWGSVGLNYYLLDVVREKAEAPDLRRRIVELDEHWQADATIIEDGDVGRAIAQELRRSTDLVPILRHPRFDKRARLEIQSSRFEAGQVHLPIDAPWLATYIEELLAFPAGRHDDQVDSTSQPLDWLTARDAASQPIVQRDVVRRNVVRRDVIPPRRR